MESSKCYPKWRRLGSGNTNHPPQKQAGLLVDEFRDSLFKKKDEEELKYLAKSPDQAIRRWRLAQTKIKTRSGENKTQQTIIHQVYPREDREITHKGQRERLPLLQLPRVGP